MTGGLDQYLDHYDLPSAPYQRKLSIEFHLRWPDTATFDTFAVVVLMA